MQKNLILLSLALLALVSCSQPKSSNESHIYIISTNDMHANIEAMPRLATLVKEYEAKGEVICQKHVMDVVRAIENKGYKVEA